MAIYNDQHTSMQYAQATVVVIGAAVVGATVTETHTSNTKTRQIYMSYIHTYVRTYIKRTCIGLTANSHKSLRSQLQDQTDANTCD